MARNKKARKMRKKGHLWVVLKDCLEGDVDVGISDLGDGIKLGSQNQGVLFVKLELSITVGLVSRRLLCREGTGLGELVLFRGLEDRKREESTLINSPKETAESPHLSQHLLDKALVDIGCLQGQRVWGVDCLSIRRWIG